MKSLELLVEPGEELIQYHQLRQNTLLNFGERGELRDTFPSKKLAEGIDGR